MGWRLPSGSLLHAACSWRWCRRTRRTTSPRFSARPSWLTSVTSIAGCRSSARPHACARRCAPVAWRRTRRSMSATSSPTSKLRAGSASPSGRWRGICRSGHAPRAATGADAGAGHGHCCQPRLMSLLRGEPPAQHPTQPPRQPCKGWTPTLDQAWPETDHPDSVAGAIFPCMSNEEHPNART